MKIPLPILELD